MNRLARITVFLLALLLWPGVSAAASGEQENLVLAAQSDTSGELDMDEYLYGHVGDAYGWHITTVNGHHVTVHLPVIVRSKTTGWHIFSSKHIEEGEEYEGFRIAAKGEPNEGKLVEVTPAGIVRPLDISITKNVFGLMVNSLVVVLLVLLGARWYRKHDAVEEAPHGFAGIVEMLVTMIEDDIIKVCVGPDYKRYSPYLLTYLYQQPDGHHPAFPGRCQHYGKHRYYFYAGHLYVPGGEPLRKQALL